MFSEVEEPLGEGGMKGLLQQERSGSVKTLLILNSKMSHYLISFGLQAHA